MSGSYSISIPGSNDDSSISQQQIILYAYSTDETLRDLMVANWIPVSKYDEVIKRVGSFPTANFTESSSHFFPAEHHALTIAKQRCPQAAIITIFSLRVYPEQITPDGLIIKKENIDCINVYKLKKQIFAYLDGDLEHYLTTFIDPSLVKDLGRAESDEDNTKIPSNTVVGRIVFDTLLLSSPAPQKLLVNKENKDSTNPSREFLCYQIKNEALGNQRINYYENTPLPKDKSFVKQRRVYLENVKDHKKKLISLLQFTQENFSNDQQIFFTSEQEAFMVARKRHLEAGCTRTISIITFQFDANCSTQQFIESAQIKDIQKALVFRAATVMDFKNPAKVLDQKSILKKPQPIKHCPYRLLNIKLPLSATEEKTKMPPTISTAKYSPVSGSEAPTTPTSLTKLLLEPGPDDKDTVKLPIHGKKAFS